MGTKVSSMPPTPDDNDPFTSLRKNSFSDDEYEHCFKYYDSQKHGFWTREDFRRFLNGLFSNKRKPYLMSNESIDQYFHETDFNHDQKIDFDEFLLAWKKTIKYAVRPISALVIVDVQNDFISGSLALHSCPANHQGEEVVPIINQVIRNVNFDIVAYTYDWHPLNHISFYENRHLRKTSPESRISADKAHVLDSVTFIGAPNLAEKIEQVLWPAHCIQKTPGADLHPDLIRVDNAIHVYKGTNPEIDSYSAFWDNMKLSKTSLDAQLKERSATDVYVVGLATDVCVASTALHAVENNYRTVLIEDACRGVNEHVIEAKRTELNKNGSIFVYSDAVPAMVAGEDRRPEIARGTFVENLKTIGRYHPRDLTHKNPSISTSKTSSMPITRAVERNSLSLPSSPHKSYTISSHLQNQYQNDDSTDEKTSPKRTSDMPRKNSGAAQKNAGSVSVISQSSRRQLNHDALPSTRGRSNTDVQSVVPSSSTIKQQQTNLGGSGSDKAVNHQHHHSHPQSPVPPKLKCMLPTTACQPSYVTATKLFNMMGYGLENQYLFMLAHYLYIVDCRSREKFNESHIVTAIHWEDALNGTVYISIVERFSEIILYDEKGIFFNTTTEMRRVYNRFSTPGAKSCLTLSGGFEAFRTFFPFVCTQTDVRSTVDREKFLTIYPSVVIDNQLYLGTGHQATNWKVVRDLKLTHIINISVEHQCVFTDKIKYLHLQLEDMEDVLLKDRFDETIRFMETAFQNPSSRILVHCNLGISRSTTLILAYLMKTYNATLLEAFKYLRHRRPIVCPNVGFLQQLVDFEYELFSHAYSDPNDPIFH